MLALSRRAMVRLVVLACLVLAGGSDRSRPPSWSSRRPSWLRGRSRLLGACYPVSFCVDHGLVPAPPAALARLESMRQAEIQRRQHTGSRLPPINELPRGESGAPSFGANDTVSFLGTGARRWAAAWARERHKELTKAQSVSQERKWKHVAMKALIDTTQPSPRPTPRTLP